MSKENDFRDIKLAVLDNIPMPVWACDRNCIIVYWNEAAARLYSFTAEEAIGMDFVTLFVNKAEQEKARIDCCDIIDNNKHIRNMADDIDKHGVTRNLVTQCFPIYDIGGYEGLQVEISYEVSDIGRLQADLKAMQKEYAENVKAKKLMDDQMLSLTKDKAQRRLNDIESKERSTLTERENGLLKLVIGDDVDDDFVNKTKNEIKELRKNLLAWDSKFAKKINNAKSVGEIEELVTKIEDRDGLDV